MIKIYNQNSQTKPHITIDKTTFNLEIAQTEEELQTGLMHRKQLGKNNGMLFIFENEQIQSFWMKNTLIPLDIIFMDSDFQIINIEKATPCTKNPCQLYKSTQPSKYVLEINPGFNFSTSSQVDIKKTNLLIK